MTASAFRISWLTVLAGLAVTVVLSACNGNPAATSVPEDTPAATATATPTTTPAPTPIPTATAVPAPTPIPTATAVPAPTPIPTATATPAPAPAHTPTPIPAGPIPEPPGAVANLDIDVDSDTVWQELFDGFTASEQSCIREALGSESLQTTLEQPVLSHPDTGEREAQIFSCLGPQVAESVSFSILVAGMEEEIETKLSEDEKSCVREAFADTDVPALITAPDGSADAAELGIAMLSCAPAQFLSSALGVDVELSEDEAACLRESLAGIDAAALMADDDSAASAELGMAMLSCVPGQILSSVIGEDVELSEDEASCLRESLTGIDAAALMADDDSAASAELGMAMLSCVPGQILSSVIDEDVELSEDEAACLRESFAAIDVPALIAAPDGSAASAELGMAMLGCVPGQILSTVIGEDVELSEDEASCLRELVANTDVAALVVADEDSAAYLRFGAGLLVCVPDLFITGGEGDAGAASDEDHANSGGEAIAVTVGRSA